MKAGWALHSKRPRTHDDYGILAASDWPCTPAAFDEIITRHMTGDVPAGDQADGGAGLPWVTFGAVRLSNEPLLCVIQHDWAGDRDATSRPIVSSKMLCVPFAELQGPAISLRNLYTAARPHLEGWNLPDRLYADTITLDVQPGDPDELAKVVGNFGMNRLIDTAAAVVDREVALLDGEALTLLDRIDFIDGVAAFLPAGAKTWLRAATWSEKVSGNTAVIMAFTRRAPERHVPMSLSGSGYEPVNPHAQRYRQTLEQLCAKKGLVQVIEHLAGFRAATTREPAEVLKALMVLDFEAYVIDTARQKVLKAEDVHRLHREGALRLMRSNDRLLILGCLLELIGVAEFGLVGDYWMPELYPRFLALANRLALDNFAMHPVYEFADQNGFRDRLVVDLLRKNIPSVDDAVTQLMLQGQAGRALVQAVSGDSDIANRLVLAEVSRNADNAVVLARRLREEPICRLYPMINAVLFGERGVTGDSIAAMERQFPGKAVELVRICLSRWREHLDRITLPLASWLLSEQVPDFPPDDRSTLVKLFSGTTAREHENQAQVDLLCYGLDGRPNTSVFEVVQRGDSASVKYAQMFAGAKHSVSRQFADRVVNGVVEDTRRKWTDPRAARYAMDFLRQLDAGWTDGRDADRRLLRVVAEIVESVPSLVNDQVFDIWRPGFEANPGLLQIQLPSRQAPQGAPAQGRSAGRSRQQQTRDTVREDIASQCVDWMVRGASGQDTAKAFAEHLQPDDVEPVIAQITRLLHFRVSEKHVVAWLGAFMREVVRTLVAPLPPEQRAWLIQRVEAGVQTKTLLLAELNGLVPDERLYKKVASVVRKAGMVLSRSPSEQPQTAGPEGHEQR